MVRNQIRLRHSFFYSLVLIVQTKQHFVKNFSSVEERPPYKDKSGSPGRSCLKRDRFLLVSVLQVCLLGGSQTGLGSGEACLGGIGYVSGHNCGSLPGVLGELLGSLLSSFLGLLAVGSLGFLGSLLRIGLFSLLLNGSLCR